MGITVETKGAFPSCISFVISSDAFLALRYHNTRTLYAWLNTCTKKTRSVEIKIYTSDMLNHVKLVLCNSVIFIRERCSTGSSRAVRSLAPKP